MTVGATTVTVRVAGAAFVRPVSGGEDRMTVVVELPQAARANASRPTRTVSERINIG
jgi:hypothetical protein